MTGYLLLALFAGNKNVKTYLSMDASVCLCILSMLTACVFVASRDIKDIVHTAESNIAEKQLFQVKELGEPEYDVSEVGRVKRMVSTFIWKLSGKAAVTALKGKQATAKIIKKAKRINSHPFYRVFEKPGGLPAAVEDFKQFMPAPVYKYDDDHWGFVWTARTADRVVLLSERGMNNLPEIKISKSGKFDELPLDVITYKQ